MSSSGVNYNDVKKMKKDFEKIYAEQEKFMLMLTKNITARLLTKVIKRTPVAAKDGGTLRQGWTVGDEDEARATKDGDSSNFKNVNGKNKVNGLSGKDGYLNKIEVEKIGDNYNVTVVNPVQYASYVEYGHRTPKGAGWVPGKFMLTISEAELRKDLPKIVEAKVEKQLRKCLNGK